MGQLPGLRTVNRLSRFVLGQLEGVAGARSFSSIADFLEIIALSRANLSARLRAAKTLLHSPEVGFLIVTTPEPDRLRDAQALMQRMLGEGYGIKAIVVNRAKSEVVNIDAATLRDALLEVDALRGSHRRDGNASEPKFDSMLDRIDERLRNQKAVAERLDAFATGLPKSIELVQAPELPATVRNLSDLSRLARELLPARSD